MMSGNTGCRQRRHPVKNKTYVRMLSKDGASYSGGGALLQLLKLLFGDVRQLHGVYTYAGQEEMAGIVYQKLTELGYLG